MQQDPHSRHQPTHLKTMSKEEEERYQINVKHGIMALNFIVAQRSASGATAAAQKKIKPSQTNRKKGKKKHGKIIPYRNSTKEYSQQYKYNSICKEKKIERDFDNGENKTIQNHLENFPRYFSIPPPPPQNKGTMPTRSRTRYNITSKRPTTSKYTNTNAWNEQKKRKKRGRSILTFPH